MEEKNMEGFLAYAEGINVEKVKLYSEFIGVVIDMLKMGKPQDGKIKGLAIKLQFVGLKMLLIASDDTVENFIKWRALAMGGGDAKLIIEAFGDIVSSMRKEFIDDTKRSAEDVLDILF